MNKVFYKSSKKMDDLKDNHIKLIITSPPYFNIKDYSSNGTQDIKHSDVDKDDIGNISIYSQSTHRLKGSELVRNPCSINDIF